jgi:hypothetical protein
MYFVEGHNFHVEWHLKFEALIGEKCKSMPRVTIHRRPENNQLGMQFVQRWLRKTIYGLCRSRRGLGDLQLCYSPVGPLLLKNLKQNTIEQGQVEFFKTAVPRVRAHVRRCARGHASSRCRSTGHNRRCTAATAGPTAPPKPSSPRVPHSQAEQTDLAAAQPMAAPPYFACAPAHVSVHAPRRPWAAIVRRASHRPCAIQ